MKSMSFRLRLTAAASVLVLAACGGGGDNASGSSSATSASAQSIGGGTATTQTSAGSAALSSDGPGITAASSAAAVSAAPTITTSPDAGNPGAVGTTPTLPAAVAASVSVIMPLEVMGAAATTVEVTVPAAAGASAKRLWMQANNLSYDGKASVQVNDGPWVTLTNATASVEGPGKAYGGIGGGYNTIKLSVPVSGAINGRNVVRFRFNGTDGVSSGFRVLAFDLRDASNAGLVEASVFAQDDPANWTAPLDNRADIAAGANLWRTATLNESSMPGARQLQAHCMDCHAQDGRDLHRFNYSNHSIIARSQYHGLSETQGRQIASYIRSLTATMGVPGDNCRPWNPPYQPGPGLDSRPVADWTCGAGLDAVLDKDSDSLQYIFPAGINKQAIAAGSKLDARNIPIGLQLPDWKHWLPRVHPKDAWGAYFTDSNLNKEYAGEGAGSANYNMRGQLAGGGADYVSNANSNFFGQLYYWGVEWGERFHPAGMGTEYQYTIAQQKNIYGTAQWLLVKNWELAQEFNLETLCPQAYINQGSKKAEERSWCGQWRFVFDTSPHILKFPPANSMFGNQVAHYYTANAWYELQLLLNPGSGMHNVHLPTDWQYAYGLLNDLRANSGRPEPMRNLIYVVKGTQEMDNGNGAGVTNMLKGWTFRDASPLDVWNGGRNDLWTGVPDATRQAVVNAYLETWLDRSESYPASTWQRLGGSNPIPGESCGWSMRGLCWIDYVPGTTRGSNDSVENFATWSFNRIPLMRTDGVDNTLLNRYARLMNNLYPSGNYLSLLAN
jgi:hypothetical protein